MAGGLPSLLPYLESAGTCRLSISVREKPGPGSSHSCFNAADDTDPLTLLLNASFVTDADSEIRKVFLLIQRDHYLLQPDILRPLTNPEVDRLWQESFAARTASVPTGSAMVLSGQIDSRGGLEKFSSVFYCIKKRKYFHPVCPKCGLPLEQCEDDDLLQLAGLQTYSRSLSRYLYCGSCYASEAPVFYAYECDAAAPSFVKDRFGLIQDFGLISGAAEDALLPCPGCPDHAACFGSEALAGRHIQPLSFYPFRMIITEALSCRAADFLALISGASPEKVAGWQAGVLADAPLLFSGEEKFFLEALYLKLSFVRQTARYLLNSADLLNNPALGISIGQVWISIPEQKGFLPQYWYFAAEPVRICLSSEIPAVAGAGSSPNAVFSFGLLHLYALLVNEAQDFSAVLQKIREISGAGGPGFNQLVEGFSAERGAGVFSPSNNFWSPAGRSVRVEWRLLWERALRLAFSLLEAGIRGQSEEAIREYLQQLDDLRETIKTPLFQEPTPPGKEAPEPLAIEKAAVVHTEGSGEDDKEEQQRADTEIHALLLKIAGRWQAEHAAEQEMLRKAEAAAKANARPEQEDSLLEKTVILGRPGGGKEKAAPDAAEAAVAQAAAQKPPEASLADTVILGRESAAPVEPGTSEPVVISKDLPPAERPVEEPDEDIMVRTVILGAEKKPPQPQQEEPVPEEKPPVDFLEATVIIEPGKGRDKKGIISRFGAQGRGGAKPPEQGSK